MRIEIAGRSIEGGAAPLAIAEIGNNHDGSLGQGLALVDAAAEAGAGAVKLQTHIAEAEMLPSTPTPPHFDEPRFAFTKRMELSEADHRRLAERARQHGLLFISSPFSVEAVELLERVDVDAYKIASGEVTNPPLLAAVAATGKPVLLSTGMSGLDDIDRAVQILRAQGSEVCVLQCTSAYPCPPDQVDLRAMISLGRRYSCPTGLSDHTEEIFASLAAVALGAGCVEKHFTLSRRLYGPDHKASVTPEDMARLCRGIEQVHLAMGSDEKNRDSALDPVRATFEKSIVTAAPLSRGATISRSALTTKRPGTGLPAAAIETLVGRRAARDIDANELLEESDLA
ncbi:MAG: N-acetylneuraminate synthase family protein [Solirubrobacterales bacterium]